MTMDQARTAVEVASAAIQARLAERGVADQQIAEGQVLEDGRSAELFRNPQHPQLANFLAKVLRY